MTTPNAEQPRNRTWRLFMIISIVLIATFLWRLVVPAHEYPKRGGQIFSMILDALMVVALVGLGLRLERGKVLFGFALAAGLGLFAIRFTSDAAWWTGHFVYYIEPR